MNFLLSEMKSAQEAGEVGADPTIPFAETVYTSLRDQAPDAYAKSPPDGWQGISSARCLDHAARTGDQALYSSAMHMARAAGR